MRTDVAPARFNRTHRFSQFALNSDLNTLNVSLISDFSDFLR